MAHSHVVDKLGVLLSALCAVHCALTPFVVLAFPALDHVEHSETSVHFFLALLLLAVTVYAFARGYRQHGRKDISSAALAGLILLFAALLSPRKTFDLFSLEAVMTTLGSAVLISAHLANLRNMRCCRSCGRGEDNPELIAIGSSGLERERAVANNTVF